MKDHQISAIVNAVTGIAREYGNSGQLRAQIAGVLVPVLHDVPDLEHIRKALTDAERHLMQLNDSPLIARELRAALRNLG